MTGNTTSQTTKILLRSDLPVDKEKCTQATDNIEKAERIDIGFRELQLDFSLSMSLTLQQNAVANPLPRRHTTFPKDSRFACWEQRPYFTIVAPLLAVRKPDYTLTPGQPRRRRS